MIIMIIMMLAHRAALLPPFLAVVCDGLLVWVGVLLVVCVGDVVLVVWVGVLVVVVVELVVVLVVVVVVVVLVVVDVVVCGGACSVSTFWNVAGTL